MCPHKYLLESKCPVADVFPLLTDVLVKKI